MNHGLALLLPSACLLGGCATLTQPSPGPAPPPLPPEIAAYYTYPRPAPPLEARVSPGLVPSGEREFTVRFPLSIPSGFTPIEPEVEFEWFQSALPGRQPAILFHPILGGGYTMERGICRHLARAGFHVALVHRRTMKITPELEFSQIEQTLRQGILRIRQVVDWIAAQDTVDPERLGSFGVSMGGIFGVMTAAVEPRLKAHVVALAGGSLADILTASPDPLLAKPRASYLAAHQISREEMERRLRQAITTDPLRLAPFVDGRYVYLFIALNDHTIGRANALRLWHALARPRTTFMLTGHYTSYVLLPYVKWAGTNFLRRTLGEGRASEAPGGF